MEKILPQRWGSWTDWPLEAMRTRIRQATLALPYFLGANQATLQEYDDKQEGPANDRLPGHTQANEAKSILKV